MKHINQERVRKMIGIAIQVSGSQHGFAKEVGIPQSLVSQMLSGRRPVNKRMLKWLGLERVILYRRVDGGKF